VAGEWSALREVGLKGKGRGHDSERAGRQEVKLKFKHLSGGGVREKKKGKKKKTIFGYTDVFFVVEEGGGGGGGGGESVGERRDEQR